jgi:hypothetical protein
MDRKGSNGKADKEVNFMWAWVKGIFGTPEVITTVAAGVKTGFDMFDKAFYTQQEKAENGIKFVDIWLKLQMILANDNSIAAITRRFLAMAIVSNFLFLLTFAAMIYKVDKEWSAFILKIIIDGYLGYLVLAVIGTMFTFYGVGKYISKDNIPFSTASIDGTNGKKEEK